MAKKKAKELETDIEFRTEKRKIRDLIPYEYNPRTITRKQYKDLERSFNKFGYVELVAINEDNTILAGHQRICLMMDLGWGDKEIEVRVPNRHLTEAEFKDYLIVSNVTGGDFDYDLLANHFDCQDLLASGFEEKTLLQNFEIPGFGETDEDDQPDLTEEKKKKTCPNCGHEL